MFSERPFPGGSYGTGIFAGIQNLTCVRFYSSVQNMCCLARGELAWLFLEPDIGLDHCLRIPVLCFRALYHTALTKHNMTPDNMNITLYDSFWSLKRIFEYWTHFSRTCREDRPVDENRSVSTAGPLQLPRELRPCTVAWIVLQYFVHTSSIASTESPDQKERVVVSYSVAPVQIVRKRVAWKMDSSSQTIFLPSAKP